MKIAILGSGAMGMLFGSYLSAENDVVLIDIDMQKVNKINADGVIVHELDGAVCAYHPSAACDSSALTAMDLVIVFVKAMYSRDALLQHSNIIGKGTYVLTLQNGAGHEEILQDFVPLRQIIIGTTQHNSSVVSPGEIHHGGNGSTYIGVLEGDSQRLLPIAQSFSACGINTAATENIGKFIWHKMFTNVSASALTAVLQVKMGFLADCPYAWALTESLVREAVDVANGDGLDFNADLIVQEVKAQLNISKNGVTSICADLHEGRKTEVDTISGSVVKASIRNGIPAPRHTFMVELIHALEDRSSEKY